MTDSTLDEKLDDVLEKLDALQASYDELALDCEFVVQDLRIEQLIVNLLSAQLTDAGALRKSIILANYEAVRSNLSKRVSQQFLDAMDERIIEVESYCNSAVKIK